MLAARILKIEHHGNHTLVLDTEIVTYEVRISVLASIFDGLQLVGVWRTTDASLYARIKEACQLVYDKSPLVDLDKSMLQELGAVEGYDITQMPDYDTLKPFLRRMARVVPPYVEDGDE